MLELNSDYLMSLNSKENEPISKEESHSSQSNKTKTFEFEPLKEQDEVTHTIQEDFENS